MIIPVSMEVLAVEGLFNLREELEEIQRYKPIEIRTEYLDQLKKIAYWQRLRLRDVIDQALRDYLDKHNPTAPETGQKTAE